MVGYDVAYALMEERRMAANRNSLPAADSKEQASKGPRRLVLVLSTLALAGVLGILYWGQVSKPWWEGASDKDFWDYLELLVVPAALALGIWWLNRRQAARDDKAQEAQVQRALDVENERAQEAAVQAYLDQLSQLLLTQRGQELIRMRVDDEVRQVIQARSEPLLRGLVPTRRWSLILFMSVMGLLAKDRALVNLAGTDLRRIDGHNAPLQGIDLQGINLNEANLSDAHLERAFLYEANLSGANLRGAHLEGANLVDAYLREAELSGVHLEGAYLTGQDLGGVDLRNAYLTATYLAGAKLSAETILSEDLEEANGDHSTDVGVLPRPTWWTNLPGDYWAPLWAEEYSIKVWKILLYFSAFGEGWQSELGLPYGIGLSPAGLISAGASIGFVSGPSVSDPNKPKDAYAVVPAPKDTEKWVDWFEKHPYLRSTTEPQEWESPSGDAAGMQLYVEVDGETPDNILENDPVVSVGVPIVPSYSLSKGKRSRVIVVESEDEWLLIFTESSPDAFDQFRDRVDEEILSNLYWGRKALVLLESR